MSGFAWNLSRDLFVPIFAAYAANSWSFETRSATCPSADLRVVEPFRWLIHVAAVCRSHDWMAVLAHGFCVLHAQQRQSECPGSRTTVKIAKWSQLGMFECLVGVSFFGVPTALRCRALLLRGCMMSFLKFDSARFR